MKKLISLILVLALSLTAVSALAETVADAVNNLNEEITENLDLPVTSSVELAELLDGLTPDAENLAINVPVAGIEIVATDEDVAGVGENTLLTKLSDPENEEGLNLANMYADETVAKNIVDARADQTDAVDLANTVPAAPMELPAITVAGEVEEQHEAEIVAIEVETNQFTNDYLEQLNTEDSKLYAVFTYEKNGEIVSCIIDYEIKSDDVKKEYSIVYLVPLGVVAEASGQKPFINFVVEVAAAEEEAETV